MKNRFRATCRYCRLVIEWSESYREWDRVTPNKSFDDAREQRVICALAPHERHDPQP